MTPSRAKPRSMAGVGLRGYSAEAESRDLCAASPLCGGFGRDDGGLGAGSRTAGAGGAVDSAG